MQVVKKINYLIISFPVFHALLQCKTNGIIKNQTLIKTTSTITDTEQPRLETTKKNSPIDI